MTNFTVTRNSILMHKNISNDRIILESDQSDCHTCMHSNALAEIDAMVKEGVWLARQNDKVLYYKMPGLSDEEEDDKHIIYSHHFKTIANAATDGIFIEFLIKNARVLYYISSVSFENLYQKQFDFNLLEDEIINLEPYSYLNTPVHTTELPESQCKEVLKYTLKNNLYCYESIVKSLEQYQSCKPLPQYEVAKIKSDKAKEFYQTILAHMDRLIRFTDIKL